MNENQSERSGRRRRGGRGRSNNRDNRDYRPESRSAPQKQTLWQKIVGIFRPKAKASEARPARNYPAYEPRQKSAERSEPREQRAPREQRESRPPETIEVTTPKLYIGNLSFDTTESDLSELFNGVGQVQNAEIVTHKETEKSKGFGFVTMTTVEEAVRAVTELHDKEFMGRKLVVSGAKTPGR
jgi:RNA recognition motif-containing protein